MCYYLNVHFQGQRVKMDFKKLEAAGIAQLDLRLATGWTVRGSKTGALGSFLDPSRPAPRPTQPPLQGVSGLSREDNSRGVAFTTHSHLAPRKSRAIPLSPVTACLACYGKAITVYL